MKANYKSGAITNNNLHFTHPNLILACMMKQQQCSKIVQMQNQEKQQSSRTAKNIREEKKNDSENRGGNRALLKRIQRGVKVRA